MPPQRNSEFFSLSDQTKKKTLLGSIGVFVAGAAGVLSAIGAFWPSSGHPKFEGNISLNDVGNDAFLIFLDRNAGQLVEINGMIDESFAGSSALVAEHCDREGFDDAQKPTETDGPTYIDRWLDLPVLRVANSSGGVETSDIVSEPDLYAHPELVSRVQCSNYSVKFVSSIQSDFYPSYEGSGTYLAPVVGFFVPTRHRGTTMKYILREEPRPN